MLVTLHFFLDTGATQCYTSTLVNTEHCGKEEEGKWRMGANVDYNGAVKAFCNAWIPAQPLRKSIRPTFLCMETLYMNTDGVVWHFFSASGLSDYRAQSFTRTLLNIFFFFFLDNSFSGAIFCRCWCFKWEWMACNLFFVCFLPLPVEVFVLVTHWPATMILLWNQLTNGMRFLS